MEKTIFSFNVNGIRSAISKGFVEWLNKSNPDIVCIQETKAQPEQIDTSVLKFWGYNTYIHSAQKKGYSGVAILSKKEPDNIVKGIGIDKYDNEGRLIRTDFGDITIINSYFPSGTTGDIRQTVKMNYLNDFLEYINELKKTRPNIIVSGDFNVCHNPIDISKPENKKRVSGFLPEEREWVSKFLESGFVDSFRHFNSEPDNYTWWSYRAGSRAKNLGWRIDYHMVSEPLKNRLISASILKDVVMSDHCPLSIDIKF